MREQSGPAADGPPSYRLEKRRPLRHLSRVTRGNMTKTRREAGHAVRVRRVQLGMRSQQALADAADVDVKTVGKVERGEKIGENSMIALDIALGWKPGRGIGNLLANEQPEDVTASSAEPQPAPAAQDSERYPDLEPALRSTINLLRKQGVPEEAIMRAVARIVENRERNGSATDRDDPDTHRGQVG